MQKLQNVHCNNLLLQALHKTSLRESACTMRVCDVLLSLVTTLIDLGLLANCKGQKDKSKGQNQQGISSPPTSSKDIFSSPTKEVVDPVSNKRYETTAREAKKIEKEVNMVRENLRDDKDVEKGLSGIKDHVGMTTDQGGNNEKTEEKMLEEEDRLSHHNTFMDIVIR